jgi:hypothetical protein
MLCNSTTTQNQCVKVYRTGVVGSFMVLTGARFVPAGVDGSRFTWSTSEAAILHLPRGASRLNRFSDESQAMTHAYSGYKFANNHLHCSVPNGSLNLITGTDKTSSCQWMAFFPAPRWGIMCLCFLTQPRETHPSIILGQLRAGVPIVRDLGPRR